MTLAVLLLKLVPLALPILVCLVISRLTETISRSSTVCDPTASVVVRNTPCRTPNALVAAEKLTAGLPVHQCAIATGRREIELVLHIFKLGAQRAAVA